MSTRIKPPDHTDEQTELIELTPRDGIEEAALHAYGGHISRRRPAQSFHAWGEELQIGFPTVHAAACWAMAYNATVGTSILRPPRDLASDTTLVVFVAAP